MASMVSGADCPSPIGDTLIDAQRRLDIAEEALERAVNKDWALDTTLSIRMSRLEKFQTDRNYKKKLASLGKREYPTVGRKLEAALHLMDKIDKELSELRLKHGIISVDDGPLLPQQTVEERHWHNWLYSQPNLFGKEPGWEIVADEAWQTWLNQPHEGAAKN